MLGNNISYIAPFLVLVLSLLVSAKSKKIRIPLLILGVIPLLVNHVIEFDLVTKLYTYDSEFSYATNNDSPIVVLDEKNRDMQARNFEKITSNIEVMLVFMLFASLAVIILSNISKLSFKFKVLVRGISFVIVLLFFMPMYGDKHPDYGDNLHAHFIWESYNSYVHIH